MFTMTTFVAVGISRSTDDVIGVKTDWKENNNKDRLFSGRNRKANGWSTKGKMSLPKWRLSQDCFLTLFSLQSWGDSARVQSGQACPTSSPRVTRLTSALIGEAKCQVSIHLSKARPGGRRQESSPLNILTP